MNLFQTKKESNELKERKTFDCHGCTILNENVLEYVVNDFLMDIYNRLNVFGKWEYEVRLRIKMR